MKRILHVVGGMNQGGTENFIMNLYRNIDKKKIQFDFLVNRDGFFDEEIKKMGGKIYHIPALQKVGMYIYKKNIDNFFKEHNYYKVIHSHINKVSGLILERANKANIPIRISHSHGSNLPSNIFIRLYKEWLGTKIVKNSTHMFACSENAAKFLYKNDYNKAYIIKNGINISNFKFSKEKRKKLRNQYKINDDTMAIGNIARFNIQKNHDLLLDIFNEYLKINNNACLILVGEGELESKIREKVKKLNLSKYVIFAGITKDTSSFYSAFDCFILPSLSEGLGIVLIEAQASGLKCLTSENAVPREAKITNNLNYINLKSLPKEWAVKISKNETREKINYIDNYDIKNIVKRLEDFYLNENDSVLEDVKITK